MGQRGPAKTPAKIQMIKGNPGRRKINQDHVTLASGKCECPDFLTPDAADEWERIAPILERTGILTPADQSALACYCQSYADYKKAVEMLDKHGDVIPIKDAAGTVRQVQPSPYVAIKNKAQLAMLRFMQQFGLTPSSRAGIPIINEDVITDAFEMRVR